MIYWLVWYPWYLVQVAYLLTVGRIVLRMQIDREYKQAALRLLEYRLGLRKDF